MTNAEKVVARLAARGMHSAVAESCTGGLAAAELVRVPDASRVLEESFITYSESAKIRRLGVPEALIAEHGVVSEAVAGAIAAGAARAAGAEVGVGVTAYAGPSGGDAHAGIGTVCFGFSVCGEVRTWTCRFGDVGRNEVRAMATDFIFEALAALLDE